MPPLDFTLLAAALIILNAWTFLLFGLDKRRALRGHWRISEHTLLTFTLLGGTIGAYAGRRVFRHKTLKPSFNRQLHGVAIFQCLAPAALAGWCSPRDRQSTLVTPAKAGAQSIMFNEPLRGAILAWLDPGLRRDDGWGRWSAP